MGILNLDIINYRICHDFSLEHVTQEYVAIDKDATYYSTQLGYVKANRKLRAPLISKNPVAVIIAAHRYEILQCGGIFSGKTTFVYSSLRIIKEENGVFDCEITCKNDVAGKPFTVKNISSLLYKLNGKKLLEIKNLDVSDEMVAESGDRNILLRCNKLLTSACVGRVHSTVNLRVNVVC